MPANEYSFVTVWKIEAPLPEVWDVISDTEGLPNWWKAVVGVKILERGEENGLNCLVAQTWQGVLPYQLSLRELKARLIEGS